MLKCRDFFDDKYVEGGPIIEQIKKWSAENNIQLEPGWKVDLSREVLNRNEKFYQEVPPETVEIWSNLFKKISE